MNYEHEYHAGNHTEVFKHSALVLLLEYLKRKPKPFVIIDTHAGRGLYALGSEKALKTREASAGIGPIYAQADLKLASTYLKIVRDLNPGTLKIYPGSPAVVRALLRDQDRLVACELRKSDYEFLRALFSSDNRASVHHRDGYECLYGLIPPRENRGLVFIDPPFEIENEFDALAKAMISGIKKWRNGIFVGWYPIKEWRRPRSLVEEIRSSGVRALSVQFCRYPVDSARLAGSGLILCNPPWQMDIRLRRLCAELARAFDIRKPLWKVEQLGS